MLDQPWLKSSVVLHQWPDHFLLAALHGMPARAQDYWYLPSTRVTGVRWSILNKFKLL